MIPSFLNFNRAESLCKSSTFQMCLRFENDEILPIAGSSRFNFRLDVTVEWPVKTS